MLIAACIVGYLITVIFFGVLSSHLVENHSNVDGNLAGIFIGVLWPAAMPMLTAWLMARWLGRKLR